MILNDFQYLLNILLYKYILQYINTSCKYITNQ